MFLRWKDKQTNKQINVILLMSKQVQITSSEHLQNGLSWRINECSARQSSVQHNNWGKSWAGILVGF